MIKDTISTLLIKAIIKSLQIDIIFPTFSQSIVILCKFTNTQKFICYHKKDMINVYCVAFFTPRATSTDKPTLPHKGV